MTDRRGSGMVQMSGLALLRRDAYRTAMRRRVIDMRFSFAV